MDKIIKVINSPLLYGAGFVVSMLALCGCILDGAPGFGIFLCVVDICAYCVLFVLTLTKRMIVIISLIRDSLEVSHA